MSKPFLTYDQQLDKLQNEKKLQIHDRAAAKEILKNIGYFSLIGGYKTPFINPMTRIYQNNTSFEDIYALLRWIFEQESAELRRKFDAIERPEEFIGVILDYVVNNRALLRSACDAFGTVKLEN